jgi:hypothetical protein
MVSVVMVVVQLVSVVVLRLDIVVVVVVVVVAVDDTILLLVLEGLMPKQNLSMSVSYRKKTTVYKTYSASVSTPVGFT